MHSFFYFVDIINMKDFQMNQTFESVIHLQEFLMELLQLGISYTMVQPQYLPKTHPLCSTLKYRSNFFLCKHNSNRHNTINCKAHARLKVVGQYLKVVQCVNVHNHEEPVIAKRGKLLLLYFNCF